VLHIYIYIYIYIYDISRLRVKYNNIQYLVKYVDVTVTGIPKHLLTAACMARNMVF